MLNAFQQKKKKKKRSFLCGGHSPPSIHLRFECRFSIAASRKVLFIRSLSFRFHSLFNNGIIFHFMLVQPNVFPSSHEFPYDKTLCAEKYYFRAAINNLQHIPQYLLADNCCRSTLNTIHTIHLLDAHHNLFRLFVAAGAHTMGTIILSEHSKFQIWHSTPLYGFCY